jgi:SOUL heme-binding protein
MVTAIAVSAVVLFLLWIVSGYLPTMNIQTPAYTVAEKRRGYEIRQYAPYVIAETHQKGSGPGQPSGGFNELFRYISGENGSRNKIPMTAPVLKGPGAEGRKIPMSAPVLKNGEGGAEMIAFVMPPGSSLEELPQPKSAAVHLRAIPAHAVAAVTFSDYATDVAIREHTESLLEALQRDGLTVRSAPRVALYNPPWTPPFMRKNEVLVEIDWMSR